MTEMMTPVRSFFLGLGARSIMTVRLAGADYTGPFKGITGHMLSGARGASLPARFGGFSRQTKFSDVGRNQDVQNVDHPLKGNAAVGPENHIQVRVTLPELDQRREELVLVHFHAVERHFPLVVDRHI